MGETIEQLVARTLAGDPLAFAALIERYQGMICGLALNSVGCFAEAEDIAQDTLVDAYRKLPALRDPGKFPSWLRSIAVNKIRAHLRRRRVRREEASDFQGPRELSDGRREADSASHESLTQNVLKAVGSLPPAQRQTIAMYYLDGRSYGDIAEFMGVPVSTVKGRMHAGRQRLREEMMNMVEHVLDSRKPGAESAGRILRRTVRTAGAARKNRDYRQVLQLCDQALVALDSLRGTPSRARTRQQVLVWRGESAEMLLARPAEAVRCFRQAREVAQAIDDADGQARAIRAIVLTSARAGDFAAVRRYVEEGVSAARRLGDDDLAAFCAAARELADDPARKDDPGLGGGFTLGHFRIAHRGAYWTVQQPNRVWRGSEAGNLYVNRHCGTPAFALLLCHLYGPQRLLPTRPKVGMRWKGRFSGGSLHVDYHDVGLEAESIVESDIDTVDTPAGRFPKCLRVKTEFRVVRVRPPQSDETDFVIKTAMRTRRVWLAPGVGLVRVVRGSGESDIVLAEYKVAPSRELLPMTEGNRWRYEGLDGYPHNALSRETWRVIRRDKRSVVIACASHSHEIDKEPVRELRGQTRAFLRRSEDPKLRLAARLADASGNVHKLQRIVRDARRVEDGECEASALMQLSSRYGKKGQTDKADQVLRKALDAIEATGGLKARGKWMRGLVHIFLKKDRLDDALDTARQAQVIYRRLRYPRQQAETAGVLEGLQWLARTGRKGLGPANAFGWTELHMGEKALARGSNAWGSPWPHLLRPQHTGLFCLGMCDFLRLPVRVGQAWTQTWNQGTPSGGAHPAITRRVESRNDRVSVPAGRFVRCVRVREEIRTTHGPGGSKLDAEWQGYHDGVRTCRYAPGVGLAQIDIQHANGKRTTIELVNFHVRRSGSSYFPAGVGNRWQYRWTDETGKVILHEFWRIAARRGPLGYLGFAALAGE